MKNFYFTIIDDTDDATLENIRPVYDFLTSKGIFITKTYGKINKGLVCLNTKLQRLGDALINNIGVQKYPLSMENKHKKWS